MPMFRKRLFTVYILTFGKWRQWPWDSLVFLACTWIWACELCVKTHSSLNSVYLVRLHILWVMLLDIVTSFLRCWSVIPEYCVLMFYISSGPMMHQQPPSQQYNMPPGGGQHYQGQQPPMGMMGQVNQGNHMMGQRQMPPYRPPQQGERPFGPFLA